MKRSETRPTGIVARAMFALLAAATAWLMAQPVAAATYDVTETVCGADTGGLLWAIQQANANPGPDVIDIQPGLEISGCPYPYGTGTDESSLVITDDLTILGNGATYRGINFFANLQGKLQLVRRDCPDQAAGEKIFALEASLFRIGEYETDNSGLEVTIEALTVTRVSQLAQVQDGAKLTLRDVVGEEITDVESCLRPAIEAFDSADLVLENLHLNGISSYQKRDLTGTIAGGVGKLEMYDSKIEFAYTNRAVSWQGEADIVSSFFRSAGALEIVGPGTMRVVNSLVWPIEVFGEMRDNDIFTAAGGGEMHFEASTVLYKVLICDTTPVSECKPLSFLPTEGALQALPGSTMSFKESVVHTQALNPDTLEDVFPLLDANASMTADEYTFMQPVPWQDSDELKTITGQPDLRTGSPALPVLASNEPPIIFSITFPANVTPILDGVLDDEIADAGPGGVNELFDPRGNAIMHDVLGNPRTDEGLRSIGAVQNSLVPHLTVLGVTPGAVTLEWTKPRDLENVTGYRVFYRIKGETVWNTKDVSPSTLITSVIGLTNGSVYEFQVDTLVNGSPAGHPSNIVSATPMTDAVLDCSTAVPSLETLWPPNHKLVPIDVLGIIDPDGGEITFSIDGIFQDEPVNGDADGNTRPDATGIGTAAASVRAERAGNGNGRVYTLLFTASSDGGARCAGSVEVGVPKSRNRDAVPDGPLFNSAFD